MFIVAWGNIARQGWLFFHAKRFWIIPESKGIYFLLWAVDELTIYLGEYFLHHIHFFLKAFKKYLVDHSVNHMHFTKIFIWLIKFSNNNSFLSCEKFKTSPTEISKKKKSHCQSKLCSDNFSLYSDIMLNRDIWVCNPEVFFIYQKIVFINKEYCFLVQNKQSSLWEDKAEEK